MAIPNDYHMGEIVYIYAVHTNLIRYTAHAQMSLTSSLLSDYLIFWYNFSRSETRAVNQSQITEPDILHNIYAA